MSPSSAAVLPPNELERIRAVHRYDVLDTPPDGRFDRITRMASRLLDVPIAIVSIVDTDRIWFKSVHGLDGVGQIGRDPGLCASAILSDDPWVVEDAAIDPRTLANPLVAGEFGLRFYAGVPLTTHDGYNLGTLCVIDREPREFTTEGELLLADLAEVVVDELELRRAARDAHARVAERSRHATELNDDVVQTLVVARVAFDLGRTGEGVAAVDAAIEASRRVLDELSSDAPSFERSRPTGPG